MVTRAVHILHRGFHKTFRTLLGIDIKNCFAVPIKGIAAGPVVSAAPR